MSAQCAGKVQDKPYRAPEPTIPESQQLDRHEALTLLLGKLLVIGVPVLACRLAFGEQGWGVGIAGDWAPVLCETLTRG